MTEGMARHRIETIADIEAVERRPYEEAVPFSSVYDMFVKGAARYGERPAIRYLPEGSADSPVETVTYNDLLKRVRQAANLFRALGVEEGDGVAFLMPNVPETHYAMWGAETAARACPMNYMLRTDHIVELIEAARVKVLVALAPDDELDIWSKAQEIARALPDLKILAGDGPAPDAERFLDLMERQPGDRLTFDRLLDRNTPAACFHTGGTTGAPKLAQHTHGNQVHTSWTGGLIYDLSPDDVMVNGFPLFHVAGSFVYGLSAIAWGASLVLPTRLGYRSQTFIENHWKVIDKLGVTMLAAVPAIMATVMNVPVGDADISRVRVLYSGGTPLPTELANAFEKQLDIPVRNIFGMTESAGLVTVAPVYAPRVPNSTGLRLPYAEMRVVRLGPDGPKVDEPVPTGETGVVLLKGPHVGPGYTDTARNAGTFTDDGWLISGDVGHIDPAGTVFLTGRSKDVIIRGSHNIDPAMIEETIGQHPAVEMAAAVGMPDAYAGELPMVYVTLKPGNEATADELLEFLRPRIQERPAMPKRAVILDELPLTAIGKIYKPTLRLRAIEDVLTDVLAPIAEVAGASVEVVGADNGGTLSATIAVTGGSPDLVGRMREALRDFAVTTEFVEA